MIKRIITIIVLIFAIIFGFSIYLQPDDLKSCSIDSQPTGQNNCHMVDAIVAVSGGDTEARTLHAVELYENGWAPLLIFSGAALDELGPSNAIAMRQIAINSGVPADDIIIEEEARNTQENAENTQKFFDYYSIDSVILVTSGYHQRRASIEFKSLLSSDGRTVLNSPTNDKDWGSWWWLTLRGWWLAGGEFVKIIAFYLGFAR